MRVLTLALLALFLVPSASAAWWSDVEIDVPAAREGLVLRYDQEYASAEEREQSAYLLQVESIGVAIDAFGVTRDTVALLEQYSPKDAAPSYVGRCHQLLGGTDAVRREVLVGAWSSQDSFGRDSDVAGIEIRGVEATSETTYTTSFTGTCGSPLLRPGVFREGDVLPNSVFFPDMPENLSQPARATRFEGRDALEFTYEEGGASITVTVADGIPAIALIIFTAEGEGEAGSARLTGYRAGEGALVATHMGQELPVRNPSAAFAPAAPMGPDLSALSLPYPLAEAIANVRSDPQMELDAWLRAHPDAQLVGAFYDREGRNTPIDGDSFSTDGGWGLTFGDADIYRYWYSSRSALGFGLGERLPAATRDVQNFEMDEERVDTLSTLYSFDLDVYDAADVDSMLRIAQSEGVASADVMRLEFYRHQQADGPRAYLRVSEVSAVQEEDAEGTFLQFDMIAGGLTNIGHTRIQTQETGLLTLAPGGVAKGSGVTAAADRLASPIGGLGVTAAAATGLGLIALLVKFLFPLYSRLRQDRLLDNEVRARLYERIRREPGIHRAELVDFGGIGEGATRHHLAQLTKHRLLVESVDGGFVRYFAAGEVPPDVARREAMLRAGSQRAVYELFAAEPTLSLRDAAARLDMSAPSVHRAKKKLMQAGLLPAAAGAAAVAEA